MLNVSKQQKGDVFSVKLSGSVEESVDFTTLIGNPPSTRMEVVLKEVTRVNSVGVKAWIRYFQGLQSKGVQLRFIECSTAIVEQLNQVVNFAVHGTVDSLYVPYVCKECGTELLGLYRAADLKKLQFKVPDLACPKCQSAASFDDNPQEYFAFLMRKS